MKENKTKLEQFLEWYLPKLEAKCPGKGPLASAIVSKHWDSEADKDCGPETLCAGPVMRLTSDGMQSAFVRLGQRKPAFCAELKTLRN